MQHAKTMRETGKQQIMQTKHWAMGNQIGKDKKQNFPRTECYYPFLKEEGKKGLN